MIARDYPFQCDAVKRHFDVYPQGIRQKMLYLRRLIFEVAASTEGVGSLQETLKWREPSYLTVETKSGSTVRMDWKSSMPDQYALYFNCKTTLVDTFKEIYGDIFCYEGNRSIVFDKDEVLPVDALKDCIALALTYHLNKKTNKLA